MKTPSKDILISIVLPALNEQNALVETVENIKDVLKDQSHEIIVVDDGSDDETWNIVGDLARAHPGIRGLKFARNFGHQAALLAGLSASKGDGVIMMDADGQHPPELIPKLVRAWQKGAPVVQALREDRGTGVLKRLTSKIYYRIFSWLAGTHILAGSADFRLIDRSVVDLLREHPRSSLFMRGFIPWTGLNTSYVEFEPGKRIGGSTKYTPARMFGLAKQGVMRFSVKPLRLATLLGSLTCMGALAYLIYVLFIRLFSTEYVEGWASLAGLLTLLGGIQLVVIGILGEYIGMIFETQLARPPFVIGETLESEAQPDTPPGNAD